VAINPYIFRTYDIRGKYPDDLNEEGARRIASAFANLYPYARKIVVARDPRTSSPFLADAVMKTLAQHGKEVIDIGIAPDPLFYFSIFHNLFDGGVMITGSHNAKDENGMMLHIRKQGAERSTDIIKEDLSKIKEQVFQQERINDLQPHARITPFQPEEEYIAYVAQRIHLARPLSLVIDSGNGACGYIPEKIFQKLGCEVKTLYGEFDGTFPHHDPNPYQEKNLQDLKKEVVKTGADIGFAYDTDGDRVALIDNRGRVVSGDACLFMLATHVLEKQKGPIIHDVRVSQALLDEMEKRGVKTYFSVSHHSAVIDKIIETEAVFGGEVTLHFFFPKDYYLYDDAIFASLKLAEAISSHQDPSQYIDRIPHYHTSKEVFIDTDDAKKFALIERLQEYLRKNNYDFVSVDGARIHFPHGWALARAANTTSFIKCRFEGESEQDLREIEQQALEIFEKVGVPVTKKTYEELGLS